MFDPETKYAALDERVSNMGRQIVALDHSTSNGFTLVNTKLDNLVRDLAAGQKTQWPSIWAAMGVCVGVLGLIGGMAYAPIQQGMSEIKTMDTEYRREVTAAIADLRKTSISRDEMDWRAARSVEDRDRFARELAYLREQVVPRHEYEARLHDIQGQIDRLEMPRTAPTK